MNKLIQYLNDRIHDNCYICNASLMKNYNHGVAIIKDNTGSHYICIKCSLKTEFKKKENFLI